ncbi:hypothetical protein HPT27_15035 [Permianibacter sp. IMCC34836]|uniref:tetratricopeptide repeat protein n=1 Tax=Permianibacter fluminis TaxID=2738515 RepID=UPI0015548316|nr:hypothetical protein [Permianibacter fluminis]NQD38340.1 hypothetical protein [Permianibacter fluminis]
MVKRLTLALARPALLALLAGVPAAIATVTATATTAHAADEPAASSTTPAPANFDWRAPMTVHSLPFGNALYEHYRKDPFAALTALMVADDRKQLGEHEAAAKAMLGSLQLQYGMLNESELVLTGALKDVLPAAVREQVLVNLAKVRYRANDIDGSLRRLDALPPLADAALRDEVALMRANMLLSRGDGAGAATALATVTADGDAYRYGLFNLGVAQLQQKQNDAARETFAKLLAKPARDPIARSLRDRTYLALGYAQLRQQMPAEARTQLMQVRLQGPYSNSALLGLGWSYAQNGLYAQALTPWLELLDRQPADLSVQEARLAVPFAYQSVQALPDALAGYQSALSAYEAELQKLDTALAAIKAGSLTELLPVLTDADAVELLRSQGRGDELYLGKVLTSHDFNEGLRRYRDLMQLREVLAKWKRSLPIYDEMLRNHQQRYAERAPTVESALAKLDMAGYGGRLSAASAQVEAAQQLDNWRLLANEKERASLQRLDRAKAKLDKITAVRGPMQREKDRLRLLAGTQLFDIVHDSADRQWQQRRAQRDAETALRELDERRAHLLAAREVAANRFSQFGDRIARQQGGAGKLLQRAEALMAKEAERMNSQASNELLRWRKQLEEYRLQAQLALARLQDRASLGNGGAP